MAMLVDTPLQAWHSEPVQSYAKTASLPSQRSGSATVSHVHRAPTHQHALQPAIAIRSVQGRRPHQEDSFAACTDLLGATPSEPPSEEAATPAATKAKRVPLVHYAAVFDGHGGAGSALHCTEHLASILRKHLLRRVRTDQGNLMSESSTDSLPPVLSEGLPQPMDEHGPVDRADSTDEDGAMQGWPVLSHEDVTNSLIASFEDCDASIPNSVASEGGTTAVCALVGVDKIWVANCGDSRAVIARRNAVAVPLTDDHKPERPDEQERVVAAGGHVFWNGGHRVMGVLSMSRALGDRYLKQFGVIATPEVTCVDRSPDDEFLLLASDGLWASLSNNEAVNVASACLERAQARGADRRTALRVAAQVLVKAALQQGSADNITVVLVDLQGTPVAFAPTPASPAALAAQAARASVASVSGADQLPQPLAGPSHSIGTVSDVGGYTKVGSDLPMSPYERRAISLACAASAAAEPTPCTAGEPAASTAQPQPDTAAAGDNQPLQPAGGLLLRVLSGKRQSEAAMASDSGRGDSDDSEAPSPTKRSRRSSAPLPSPLVLPCALPGVFPALSVATERLLVAVPSPDAQSAPVGPAPWS